MYFLPLPIIFILLPLINIACSSVKATICRLVFLAASLIIGSESPSRCAVIKNGTKFNPLRFFSPIALLSACFQVAASIVGHAT